MNCQGKLIDSDEIIEGKLQITNNKTYIIKRYEVKSDTVICRNVKWEEY